MRALPATKQDRAAFTIVELAVSTALLAVIVVMLAGMLGQVSRAWTTGSAQHVRNRGARVLADFLAPDLAGALLPAETVSDPGKSNLQFVINPAFGIPSEYLNADAIFWQAPIATETSFGDIAEVGYFVKWTAEGDRPARPALCRFFVNPSEMRAGQPVVNPDFLIYDPKNPKAWLEQPIVDRAAPISRASGYKGLLADNVVGMWVRSYALDGRELPRSFDSREGYELKVKYLDPAGNEATRTERRYLPATVAVSIAQLDERALVQLGPAALTLQEIAKGGDIRDAAEFVSHLRGLANPDPAILTAITGLRVYSLQIPLENGR